MAKIYIDTGALVKLYIYLGRGQPLCAKARQAGRLGLRLSLDCLGQSPRYFADLLTGQLTINGQGQRFAG